MKIELIDITNNPEQLIAEAARTCYKSEAKNREDNTKLVARLKEMGHLSTFEHAKATFRITGISRACSHQLVRHRHFSFSQMSQRYVSEKDFTYVIPPSISGKKECGKAYDDFMQEARRVYGLLTDNGVNKEDARFVLPNACETEIVVTANFRSLIEFIKLRKTEKAQWEIRALADEMLRMLQAEAPNAFGGL